MEVIPANLTDQQVPINNIRTRTYFIVDRRLDESALKSALDTLIRDHWRKLGARLITRKDGYLEYHLPKIFDDDYVLFNWSSTDSNDSIDIGCPELSFFNHPPPAEDGITFLDGIQVIDDAVRPSSWPYERKDEPRDAPLLYVHFSLFADATVIALSTPHAFCDQFGLGNIMRAWFGLTRGETPPAMVGYDEDVLANGKKYTDYPTHELCKRGKVRVRWFGEYLFVILGFIPEMIMHPEEDRHIVFFPRPYVQLLRRRYTAELQEKYGVDPGLSSGDVLYGILTKFARMHDRRTQTLTLTQTINLRGRIPKLSTDAQKHGFLHNCIYSAASRMKFHSTSTPASEVAYASRKMITEATITNPKDLEVGMVVVREMVRRGQITHVCELFDKSYGATNWCSAWKGLDLRCGGDGGDSDGGVKMLVIGEGSEVKSPRRFFATIASQTEDGFWCHFAAPPAALADIKKLLKENPMLEGW